MFGPPEKVWSDKVETAIPGLVFADHEKGRVAYIPWDVGGLYYRHSSQGHAGLMADVIDRLLPTGRQLKTDAHPLVEMTIMDQPARRRTLVHLVNGSGTLRHGVLPAGRIARHPHRAGAAVPTGDGRGPEQKPSSDGRRTLSGVHVATLEGLRGRHRRIGQIGGLVER